MAGPGSRKPLSRLVGSECCETDVPGPHSGNIALVLGRCEHGHGAIGDYDESPMAEDWRPVKICDNHWRYFSSGVEGGDVFTCDQCGHPCVLEVTATWENGNVTIQRCMPDTGEST